MSSTISITSKWQVHIPKYIRKAIKIDKPSLADIRADGGKIIITPKKSSILELAGKYHHLYKKNPIDIDNIRGLIDYSDL